jgi:Fe2+ transport system protein FeoA
LTLAEAKEGQKLIVTTTGNDEVTWQALRFGIETGAEITVQKAIPGGPVIISKNHLEIALGRQIAESIGVCPSPASEK